MTPEAQEGRSTALIRDGGLITVDATKNSPGVAMTAGERPARRIAWKMPPYEAVRGTPK